jgi:predicted ATPase/class 3 adenylate cyclase
LEVQEKTIAFLFTDVEKSTRFRETHSRSQANAAFSRHDALLLQAMERHGGHVFKTVGDAFYGAFETTHQALEAALDAQLALRAERERNAEFLLHVRMALHTGSVECRDADYFGLPLHRTHRLLEIGHGDQVLISLAAHELMRDELPNHVTMISSGKHRLRDLQRPEQVFQLRHPDLVEPGTFPPLKSLDFLPNNLPHQLDSFVGREQELTAIPTLVMQTSLLTIVGEAGVGKSRLAQQVAANMLEDYVDGVWIVELLPLPRNADGARVGQTIAKILGVPEEAHRDILNTLTDYLKSKQLLLVLDNCEHLVGGSARVAETLRLACSRLRIVTTSRQPLHIKGEHILRIRHLSFPHKDVPVTLDSVSQFEALLLFRERALAVRPTFFLDEGNLPAVIDICRRLNGIAFAIELAAARVNMLSPQDISERLTERFTLLTNSNPLGGSKLRTLETAIDWSHDLLEESERVVLRRMCVFSGGWTLQAAEAVCGDDTIPPDAVLPLLSHLQEKSLITAEPTGEAMRYDLHETMRAYARKKLEAASEARVIGSRHADYFLQLALQTRPHLYDAQQTNVLGQLENEHVNLRVALDWYLQQDAAHEALRLATVLGRFWHLRGHLSEGRRWFRRVLNHPDAAQRTAERAGALDGAGWLALKQDDYADARVCLEECLSIYREIQDPHGEAQAVGYLGLISLAQGSYAEARDLMEQSLMLCTRVGETAAEPSLLNNLGIVAQYEGDLALAYQYFQRSLTAEENRGNVAGMAQTLNNLGEIACLQKDYAQAQACYARSLEYFVRSENKQGLGEALHGSGRVALRLDKLDEARSKLRRSLVLFHDIGDMWGVSETIAAFAELAAIKEDIERMARLLGIANGLRKRLGAPFPQTQRQEHESHVQMGQRYLGEEAFQVLYDAAKEWTVARAVAEALEEDHP